MARPIHRPASPGRSEPSDKLKPNGKEGRQATDPQLARDLWNHTSDLVGLPTRL